MTVHRLPRDVLAAAWFKRSGKPIPGDWASMASMQAFVDFQAGFAAGVLAGRGLPPEGNTVQFVDLQMPEAMD